MVSRTLVTVWHMLQVFPLTSMISLFLMRKTDIVGKGQSEVDQVKANYEMGFITDKERYNQVIDAWTHVNNNTSRPL